MESNATAIADGVMFSSSFAIEAAASTSTGTRCCCRLKFNASAGFPPAGRDGNGDAGCVVVENASDAVKNKKKNCADRKAIIFPPLQSFG